MPTPIQFSATNCFNSIAIYLAPLILAEGYLIHWHERDGLETLDGFYGSYSGRDDTLLADVTVAARVAAAKGLLTLRGPFTAAPRFTTRPTVSGAVNGQDEVPVPALALEVGGMSPTANYELGTSLKWRERRLTIMGFGRTWDEAKRFEELLGVWLDHDQCIDILDHDAGTAASVGHVRILDPVVEGDLDVPGTEPATYGVELNARLEYVV